MYAVVRTGGKMYRVEPGQTIRVEKLAGESGSKIELPDVLMVRNGDDVKIGTPTLDKGKVTAEVISHGRGKKIEVFKFKRRKNYKRTQGHRQDFTELRIEDIKA